MDQVDGQAIQSDQKQLNWSQILKNAIKIFLNLKPRFLNKIIYNFNLQPIHQDQYLEYQMLESGAGLAGEKGV